MRKISLALILAATTATAGQSYIAENRLEVQASSGGFIVFDRPGSGARDAWCAAASYAQVVKNAPAAQRIYLTGETVDGGREFTISPTAALQNGRRSGQGGNYSLTLREAGYNMLTSHARGFCSDIQDEKSIPDLIL